MRHGLGKKKLRDKEANNYKPVCKLTGFFPRVGLEDGIYLIFNLMRPRHRIFCTIFEFCVLFHSLFILWIRKDFNIFKRAQNGMHIWIYKIAISLMEYILFCFSCNFLIINN